MNSSKPLPAFVVGGVHNIASPALADGQADNFELDASGNLKVNVVAGGAGGGDVNISEIGGSAEALNNPLPVELSDGTQSVGTAGNPLSVNVISGGGSNASVGADNVAAPTSDTLIGTVDAGGKLQAVSAANPLPISGSISATNPSVGPNNVTAPTSDTLIGTVDAGGKVQAVSAANPLPISGSISASNPSVGTDNVTAPTSATEIGSIDGSGKLQGASTTNPVPVALPAATVSTLTPPIPPTAAAIGTAVAAPTAAAIASAIVSNPPTISIASAQKVEVYDGTNTATVKAASSQSVTTDTSLVVQINPEQPNLTTALNVHDASPASQVVTQGTAANLNATVTPAASVAFPIADSQGTRQSVTFVAATPADTANTVAISTYANVAVTLHYSGSVTGGQMFFEISDDNSNWYGLTMAPISQDLSPIDSYTLSSAAGNVSWQMFIGAYAYFRVRMHTPVVGAGSAIVAIIPSAIASEPAVALAGGSAAVTNIGTFAVQEATLDGCISSNIVAVHDASPASQAVTNVGTFAVQATTKTALTPAAPTAASVGVASASVVAVNASRKGLILVNTSANVISLGFGNAAVLYSGATLGPYGTFCMDEYSMSTAAVYAIASGATSNLSVQEYS